MKTKRLLVLLSVMLISMLATSVALAAGPVVHSLSAGGPDECAAFGEKPGCDANFSAIALQYADGSVAGQIIDQVGHGGGGVLGAIDCFYVQGNEAWVSGVITQDTFTADHSFVGQPFAMLFKENGITANDPPDQISPTFVGSTLAFKCTDHPDRLLVEFLQGQIIVK